MIKPQVPVSMIMRNIPLTVTRYKDGFSLVELMVSITIGALLLLLLSSFFAQAVNQNRTVLLRLQLQHELNNVLQLMAKDIARSGFVAAGKQIESPNISLFSLADGSHTVITAAKREAQNSCLLFWYDLDHSGCIGSNHGGQCQRDGRNTTSDIQKELFGYRLKRKMIETRAMYKSGAEQSCSAVSCAAYMSKQGCETRGWVDLMDTKSYQIHRLQFSWLADKRGILVKIDGSYKQYPNIRYQSEAVIGLHNRLLEQ